MPFIAIVAATIIAADKLPKGTQCLKKFECILKKDPKKAFCPSCSEYAFASISGNRAGRQTKARGVMNADWPERSIPEVKLLRCALLQRNMKRRIYSYGSGFRIVEFKD